MKVFKTIVKTVLLVIIWLGVAGTLIGVWDMPLSTVGNALVFVGIVVYFVLVVVASIFIIDDLCEHKLLF